MSTRNEQADYYCPNPTCNKPELLSKFLDDNNNWIGQFYVCRSCGKVFDVKYHYNSKENTYDIYAIDTQDKTEYLLERTPVND